VTYGPCTLLRKLCDHYIPIIQNGGQVPEYAIEITSVIERTINFAHTGSTRVIATTLMNPLWVGLSLIDHGTPTFRDLLEMGETAADLPYISDRLWPRHPTTKLPFFASKRAQILTYGAKHWEVCHISLQILYTRSRVRYHHRSGAVVTHTHKAKGRVEIACSMRL
jgi:hypothetical protein